jgi:hypothetical protein
MKIAETIDQYQLAELTKLMEESVFKKDNSRYTIEPIRFKQCEFIRDSDGELESKDRIGIILKIDVVIEVVDCLEAKALFPRLFEILDLFPENKEEQ